MSYWAIEIMKRIYWIYCGIFFLLGEIYSLPAFAQKIKIACIGNSITEGVGASSGSATYHLYCNVIWVLKSTKSRILVQAGVL